MTPSQQLEQWRKEAEVTCPYRIDSVRGLEWCAGYLAAKQAGGWRPIEEAPKDGTILLLANDSGEVACARFRRADGFNPIVSALAGKNGYWQLIGSAMAFNAPTHFQPLPPPPEKP